MTFVDNNLLAAWREAEQFSQSPVSHRDAYYETLTSQLSRAKTLDIGSKVLGKRKMYLNDGYLSVLPVVESPK